MNLNLFETTEDELIKQKQKLYTKIYLVLYISSLSIILLYSATSQRILIRTYSLDSFEEYEHLYDLYQNDISCSCTQISILYGDFITKLQVDAFHQACKPSAVRLILFAGKYDIPKI